MRRVVLALTSAALVVGTLSIPVAAAGRIRMVDDDGKASVGNCGGSATAFKKVQKAVDASGRGDTVLVCPGVYHESVVIGPAKDGLTLRSTRPWAAKLVHRASDVITGPAMIVIENGADDVTIQHLALTHRAPRVQSAGRCGFRAGIQTFGQDTVINANRVRTTGGTTGPCGMAIGIAVGAEVVTAGEASASARVTNNLVRDFWQIGIRVGDAAQAIVENNSVRYWHLDTEQGPFTTARQVRRAVARQAASPAGFNAVLSAGVATFVAGPVEIRDNEISSGPDAFPVELLAGEPGYTPRLGAGILVLETDGALVEWNTIRRTFLGIELYYSDDGIVRRNVSEDHAEGITLTESSANTIRANQVSTGWVGLHVNETLQAGVGSSGNRFIANSALFHWYLDCWDETGTTTAGTVANDWIDNVGDEASPSYICEWD